MTSAAFDLTTQEGRNLWRRQRGLVPLRAFPEAISADPFVRAREMAVRAIRVERQARKFENIGCKFPKDFGCETQLYLGVAFQDEIPDISISDLARACMVSPTDAAEFSYLLELARSGDWMISRIIHAAREAIDRSGMT